MSDAMKASAAADEPSPTAKANLSIELSPLGSITGSGEVPGSYAGSLTEAALGVASIGCVTAIPAVTLYTSRGTLTATEILWLISAQFVATAAITARNTIALRRNAPK